MGQYRQWLYHREVDQQLRTKLAMLQQELHSAQEQAALLEDTTSWMDNPVIHAIAMQREALLAATTPLPYSHSEASFAPPTGKEQPIQTVSAALFAWSHLPNLDTEEIRLSDTQSSKHEELQAAPHSHAEADLLPKDIASFIDTHTHAVPHSPDPDTSTTTAPLESKIASNDRTDYSIERWVERWGRKPPATPHHTYPPIQQQLQEDAGE